MSLTPASEKKQEDVISSESLLQLFSQRYQKQQFKNERNALLLIEAMGGIKAILLKTLEINEQYQILTSKNLQHLHQIVITSDQNQCNQPQTIQPTADKIQELECTDEMVLHFNPMNNHLFSIFSQSIATKIWYILHHKYFLFSMLLVVTFDMILFFLISNIANYSLHIFIWLWWILHHVFYAIPVALLWLCTTNKRALYKIIRNGECWIMIINLLRAQIFHTLIQMREGDSIEYNGSDSIKMLSTTERILNIMFWSVTITVFLSFDGIKFQGWIKRALYMLWLLPLTMVTVTGWLESYTKPDQTLILLYDDIAISLRDQTQSAYEVMWLLLVKLMLASFIRKDTALQIKYNPKIIWINNIHSKNERNLADVIQQQTEDHNNAQQHIEEVEVEQYK